jgi:thiol-disulfide isomerase/thioredoxin
MRYVVVSSLALLLTLCVGSAGAAVPELRLHDPKTGSPVVVAPGAGALHLVLFATWCPPCEAELERLRELEARFQDRGYTLVLVAVQARQTPDRLVAYAADKSPPGRLLYDADGSVEKSLGAGEVPTHVLLDAAGNEVARAGALGPEIEAAVERLLDRRRPGAARKP